MARRAITFGGSALVVILSAAWLAAGAWFKRLPVASPLVIDYAYTGRADTARLDEPLEKLFRRHGIGGTDLMGLLAAVPELNARKVRAGQVFEFRYPVGDSAEQARASGVDVRLNYDTRLKLRRGHDGGWRGSADRIVWLSGTRRVEGEIDGSLYLSLHRAVADSILPSGELDRFIADLADEVFGWDIDFSREVADGDRFQLVFDRLTSSEGETRYGRLVGARLQTRGRINTAYLMNDSTSRKAYFDARGISLRRAFKRNPVAYLRISSGFSTRRFHPVLGLWRAHQGVDYAAHTGTEIYATANGTVRFAGRNGGYGLMVALRHPKDIETRYAHMSRIRAGIAPGVRVEQGDVIGYVGSTGLANGPHVHYEFLKNGRYLNPRSVDSGNGQPIPDSRRPEFERLRVELDRELDGPTSQDVGVRSN